MIRLETDFTSSFDADTMSRENLKLLHLVFCINFFEPENMTVDINTVFSDNLIKLFIKVQYWDKAKWGEKGSRIWCHIHYSPFFNFPSCKYTASNDWMVTGITLLVNIHSFCYSLCSCTQLYSYKTNKEQRRWSTFGEHMSV